MKRVHLLLEAIVATAIITTAAGAGPQLYVVKDTYGCIRFDAKTPALLAKLLEANDTASVSALCQQGKVATISKGTVVTGRGPEYQLPNDPMETVVLPLYLQKRLNSEMMVVRRDCLSTEMIAKDEFKISDLPRLPVHQPQKRPTDSEMDRLLMSLEARHVPSFGGVDVGTTVSPFTLNAIVVMLHLDEQTEDSAPWNVMIKNAYVCYGPTADAHNAINAYALDNTWQIEVAFNITDDATKRTWIASLHVKNGGGPNHVVSCNLGEDIPTLKGDEVTPSSGSVAMNRVTSGTNAAAGQSARVQKDGNQGDEKHQLETESQQVQRPTGENPVMTPSAVQQQSKGSTNSAYIFQLIAALDKRDWSLVTSSVIEGTTNYFGHGGATKGYVKNDIIGDSKTYRWSKSYPDLSTFHQQVNGDTVYESVEEVTEALEFSGRHHKAHCQFEVIYKIGNPPEIYSLSLKVIR
jgi:hypothetical protein